jgi:hypothetical protein
MDDSGRAAIVAVPFDAVDELEREDLAQALPVFRGAAFDAVVTIGMDSAALVTLLQAPDSIRAFAAWVRHRYANSENSVSINAKRGKRHVYLKVDGDIDVGIIADFLMAAFTSDETNS